MVVVFFAVLGLLLFLIDRAPKTGREKWQAFLFLLPAIFLLGLGLVWPIIKTAISSLTSAEVDKHHCIPLATDPGRCVADAGGSWNNFAHFRWIFTNDGPTTAFWNTILWTLVAPTGRDARRARLRLRDRQDPR